MYKILKNIIEMDDYSVQKLSKSQPPEPFEWNTVEGTELNVSDCIGGKGKIEVKGNTYQKQLSGKNKFGVSERSEVVADVDCLFKDSEILINGAQTTGRSSSKLTFKDILPAGTYHIKPKVISGTCVNGSNGHALSIVITDTNNTKLVDKWLDGLDMDFTLSEANQLKFSIWIPAGAQFNNYKVGIQIEEGSTATDYEPYCGGQASPNPLYPQNIEVVTGNNVIKNVGKNYNLNLGTIELCKIGNYQDTMFKNVVGDENYNADLEVGAWYKKKVIDKKFLDGEMHFDKSGETNVFYTPVITNYSRINNIPLCDNFKGFNNVDNAHSINIINSVGFNNKYNYNRLYISFNGTIDELKDFLNERKPTLYYANDNPTYEKITDQTLISQLEALRKAKWFKGINHWWTETDNLEPVLEGTYKQSIQSETQNSIANLQVQANEQNISNTPDLVESEV